MTLFDDDRKYILSAITRLIQLAHSGYYSEADVLISSIYKKIGSTSSEWAMQQQQLLRKIESQYGLKPTCDAGSDLIITKELPIDEFVENVKPGISLVTCCMNRSENLLKALASWLKCPEIDQIVIVDWGSKASVRDEISAAGFNDPRILVARVNNQPRWILSYAFNVGFRIVGFDKILKTDADIVINPTFFAENTLRAGTFLSGDWRTAEKGQEHINGFFFVRRADLLSIKGFNEYITTYGWDDDDIYFRLEQHGFNRVRINANGIYHIPHADAQRLGDDRPPKNALEELRQDPGAKIMGNRFLASAMPLWNTDRIFVPFVIKSGGHGYLEIEQSGESYHQVSSHIRADADYYGLVAALSWTTELTVYAIPKELLYALLMARSSRSDITRADVRLVASGELSTISWHRRLLILGFEDEVSAVEQRRVVQELVEQSRQNSFTLLVQPSIFEALDMNQASGEIRNILPLPKNFHTYQLPEQEAKALNNLAQAFANSPVLVIKLNSREAIEVSSAQAAFDKALLSRLYIHVQHGLGNRLRALASAMAMAKQTNRELILIWKPDHHCDCSIYDLFKYEGKVIADTEALDLNRMDSFNYMEIEPGSCKDGYIALEPAKDVYIKSAYALNNEHTDWEKENEILRSLVLSDQVEELINSIDVSGRIGVHIRMEGSKGTDHNTYDSPDNWLAESHEQLNLWRAKSHYSNFMNRIDAMIEQRRDLKLFLAADMAETYAVFSQKYGDRLVYLPRDAFDRSRNQLRFALADAILLSRCNYLLGSTWSSFTELARRLSTTIKTVEMSGTDF